MLRWLLQSPAIGRMCSDDPVKITPAGSLNGSSWGGTLASWRCTARKEIPSTFPHCALSYTYGCGFFFYLPECSLMVRRLKEMRNAPTHSTCAWRRKPSLRAVSHPEPNPFEIWSRFTNISRYYTGRSRETLWDKSFWVFHLKMKDLSQCSGCLNSAFHPLKTQV